MSFSSINSLNIQDIIRYRKKAARTIAYIYAKTVNDTASLVFHVDTIDEINEIDKQLTTEKKLFDILHSQLKAVETVTARWCQAKGINSVDISPPFGLPVPTG